MISAGLVIVRPRTVVHSEDSICHFGGSANPIREVEKHHLSKMMMLVGQEHWKQQRFYSNITNYFILEMFLTQYLITIKNNVTKLYLCRLLRNKDSLNRSKHLVSAFSFPSPAFFTGKEWKASFLFPSAVQESVSLDINYTLNIELELCKIPH